MTNWEVGRHSRPHGFVVGAILGRGIIGKVGDLHERCDSSERGEIMGHSGQGIRTTMDLATISKK